MNEKQLKLSAEKILKDFGLDFSQDKIKDLRNSFLNSAKESSQKDPALFMEMLLENKLKNDDLDILLKNLTVGETFFFRDEKLFKELQSNSFKEIIGKKNFITIWSAGCASGEEPYSLAILFDKFYKNKMQFKIYASDINKHSLEKAKIGQYRDWSFRSTPAWVKEEYFIETEKGVFEIDKSIKKYIEFSTINLSEIEKLKNSREKFDIIICRNVLIYFSKTLVKELLEAFYFKLNPGGFFITTASESANINKKLFSKLIDGNNSIFLKNSEKYLSAPPVNFKIQKEEKKAVLKKRVEPLKKIILHDENKIINDLNKIFGEAVEKYYAGNLNESLKLFSAIEKELIKTGKKFPQELELFFYLIKNNFRTGNIKTAFKHCEQILNKEKLDFRFHYIHGILLQENGEYEKAESAFNKSIYLNNKFPLSFFALGNLQKSAGKISYHRNFHKAAELLLDLQKEQIVKYSDGITAGELLKQIYSLVH